MNTRILFVYLDCGITNLLISQMLQFLSTILCKKLLKFSAIEYWIKYKHLIIKFFSNYHRSNPIKLKDVIRSNLPSMPTPVDLSGYAGNNDCLFVAFLKRMWLADLVRLNLILFSCLFEEDVIRHRVLLNLRLLELKAYQ